MAHRKCTHVYQHQAILHVTCKCQRHACDGKPTNCIWRAVGETKSAALPVQDPSFEGTAVMKLGCYWAHVREQGGAAQTTAQT